MTIPVLNEAQSDERAKNFTVNRLIQKVSPLIAGLTPIVSLAAHTLLGNKTGSTAAPSALTTTEVKTLLAIASSDVSGLAASATTDTTNASNISSGTLDSARLPAAATAAEYQANTSGYKVLTPAGVWSSVGAVALTDGTSIAVDMSLGFNFDCTIAGNRTLANPSNAKQGQSGRFKVTASGGTRTIAKGSSYFSSDAISWPVSIPSGFGAYIFYWVEGSGTIIITGVIGPGFN